jgi:carboxypeptidase T
MARFIVRIIADSYEKLRELDKHHLDLKERSARKEENTNKFIVTGILNDDQIQQVKSAGYKVEILSDLSQTSKERIKEVSKTNRFARSQEKRTGVSALREDAETGGYMNTDEVETALLNLSEDHSDIVSLIDLPNRTWEGRLCHAIRILAGNQKTENSNNKGGNKVDQTVRPGVLISGSMHAREWGGSDICINFLTNLLDSYANNTTIEYGETTFPPTQIKNALEQIDLFVFPDVNPDGKIYSQTNNDPNLPPVDEGIWWRKNKNPQLVPHGDSHQYHLTGVDINRNFDFLWKSGIGTVNPDGTNSNETYRGTSAFSEPETKNVKYLFDTFTNIKYFVDVHSFGEMILYSWGDDDNQNLDKDMNFANPSYNGKRGKPKDSVYKEYIDKKDEETLKHLGDRMNYALKRVRGTKYRVEQSVGLYPTSATSDDYSYSRHIVNGNGQGNNNNKIFGFTIEFGKDETGFIPPYSEMKEIIKDVSSALTELCIAATPTTNE